MPHQGPTRVLKPLLKQGVKTVLRAAGRPVRRPDARILTYHSIGNRRHDMTVSEEAFAEQMAWLRDSVSIGDLDDVVTRGHGVAVTFDDGFHDNLTVAGPILARHDIHAHLFMVAGRAGGLLPDEPDPEHGVLMTWDTLREWCAAGHGVGAHTMNHARLSRISPAEQAREIGESRKVLEDHLGTPVLTFAYPYGSRWDYTADSVDAVRRAGFAHAFSNRYGVVSEVDAPFEIRRIWIDASDTMDMFIAKVTGRLDRLVLLEHPAGMALRRVLNRVSKRRPPFDGVD